MVGCDSAAARRRTGSPAPAGRGRRRPCRASDADAEPGAVTVYRAPVQGIGWSGGKRGRVPAHCSESRNNLDYQWEVAAEFGPRSTPLRTNDVRVAIEMHPYNLVFS